MFRIERFLLAAVLALVACGAPDVADDGEVAAPDEVGDLEKADTASAVTISGGITLEDDFAVALPAPTRFLGFQVLAPAGAALKATANGGSLATRVTIYGPRAANGGYGAQLATGITSVSITAPKDGAYLVVPQPRYTGQSGNATLSMRCTGTNCQGYCTSADPKLTKKSWVHALKSRIDAAAGSPKHRAYDVVAAPNTALTLSARFGYGAVDKSLEDENVELWIRNCPGWTKIGTARTDSDGVASLAIPSLPAGDYKVLWHVPGDGTTAEGTLAIWPRGRSIAVSDIDGTLTTSDAQLFKNIFLGLDPTAYPDAEKVLWVVRRAGYRVQYLTGRPEALGRHTKDWVKAHGFPPGPVKLTDSALEVVPSESGVGAFKTAYLGHLKNDLGITLFASFGNATTDISAYQANGIPNARDFIIGPNAGASGTTRNPSYGAILPAVKAFPLLTMP